MADPKSKVQETIELLQGMVEILDRDIEIVEKNALKANKLKDAIAKGAQDEAVGRLNSQIAQIDDIILNDAEISKYIGSTESAEVKQLNDEIKAVVEAVKRIRAWKFTDRDGNEVDIGIQGLEDPDPNKGVKTDKVVDEVEKLDGMDVYEDTTTRKTAATDKKVDLESRIEIAQKLKGIYDAHPGMDKDAIIQSVYDAQTEFAGIDKKTASLEEPAEYRKIIDEIFHGFRNGENNPYKTSDGLKKLEKQIEVLKTLEGDPEIDAIISALEDAIKTTAGKKSLDLTKVKKVQEVTAKRKEFKIEDKINAAKTAVVAANKTALVNLINRNAVFDFYPEKKQQWLDLLKEENPDVDAIQAEIEAAVLAGDNPGKFEDFVNGADKDVSKLADLEKEYREADAVEKKLTALGKKHVTTQTKPILGCSLEAKRSDGTPIDIAKLDISDEDIINGLYEDFKSKSNINDVRKAYESDPVVPKRDKKPGLLRRAFWKLTHPDSWGSTRGLADELRENWVKSKIVASVEHLQEDARSADGAVWTLSPEKLEEIRGNDKKRAEDAREAARKAVIDGKGSKTAEDAEKQAREDAAKKQAEADIELDI